MIAQKYMGISGVNVGEKRLPTCGGIWSPITLKSLSQSTRNNRPPARSRLLHISSRNASEHCSDIPGLREQTQNGVYTARSSSQFE